MTERYMIFVPGGAPEGPFDVQELQQRLADGTLPDAATACAIGGTEWVSIRTVTSPVPAPPPTLVAEPPYASNTPAEGEPSAKAGSTEPRRTRGRRAKWMLLVGGLTAGVTISIAMFWSQQGREAAARIRDADRLVQILDEEAMAKAIERASSRKASALEQGRAAAPSTDVNRELRSHDVRDPSERNHIVVVPASTAGYLSVSAWGALVEVPASLFGRYRTEPNRLISDDDATALSFDTLPPAAAETALAEAGLEAKLRGRSVTLQRIAAGGFVLSGFEGENVFYDKAIPTTDGMVRFSFSYAVVDKGRIDPLVGRIAATFKFAGAGQ